MRGSSSMPFPECRFSFAQATKSFSELSLPCHRSSRAEIRLSKSHCKLDLSASTTCHSEFLLCGWLILPLVHLETERELCRPFAACTGPPGCWNVLSCDLLNWAGDRSPALSCACACCLRCTLVLKSFLIIPLGFS